jgi:hypothetical protein
MIGDTKDRQGGWVLCAERENKGMPEGDGVVERGLAACHSDGHAQAQRRRRRQDVKLFAKLVRQY